MTNKGITKKEETEIKKDVVNSIKSKIINELDKEIKSSIIDSTERYREELKEEISNNINDEISNALKREEKRLLRSKNFSILKKDIVILALTGLLLYFGYCLYDVKYFSFMKSECEKNGTCTVIEEKGEENHDNKEEEIVKDKAWYIENYGYLLDDIKLNLSADSVDSYYLYSADHKISEIKSAYLLNMAYSKLDSKMIKTNSINISVEGEDLKNAFEELFGSLNYYQEKSFSFNCLNFTYNIDKNRYVAENHKCNSSGKEIVEEIDNMYEEGDVLYILTVATIYNEDEKSFYTFDNLFEPIVTDVVESDLIKNAKKLNKYQYQFKKVDDKYYLDAIVKLK